MLEKRSYFSTSSLSRCCIVYIVGCKRCGKNQWINGSLNTLCVNWEEWYGRKIGWWWHLWHSLSAWKSNTYRYKVAYINTKLRSQSNLFKVKIWLCSFTCIHHSNTLPLISGIPNIFTWFMRSFIISSS